MNDSPGGMTIYQALAAIKQRVSLPLRMHEGIIVTGYEITDAVMTLTVKVHDVTERKLRTIFKPRELRGYQWRVLDDGTWSEPVVVSAPLTAAVTVHATHVTEAEETRERARWAALCYRPGTDRSPMDGALHDSPTIRWAG